MVMTILQVCTEAVEEIGIDPPTTLATGDYGRQLLAIANTCGRMLSRRNMWDELTTEGTFTTLATELQSDFDTDFPYLEKVWPHTFMNRTQQRRVLGPLSRVVWQRIKADQFSPSIPMYYIRDNKLYFPGTPTADESIYFEYMDKRFAVATDGTTLKESFTLDTDTPRLDDYMMVLAVRQRFLQRKGLEYGEAFRELEDYIEDRIGGNLPAVTMNLHPRGPGGGYLGDGGWLDTTNGLTWDSTALTWG